MKSLWPTMSSQDDVELMMIAIANRRLDGVKAQMQKGVSGNSQGHHPVLYPGKITMFAYACYQGNFDAAQLLFAPGVSLEQRNILDMTPLMQACAVPLSPNKLEREDEPQSHEIIADSERMIRWLVVNGADVNAIRVSDTRTVLHFAASGCSEDIVEFLILNGAQVDLAEDDHSAFISAARENNVPALRALARHGANINRACQIPWAEGRTALGVLMMDGSSPEAAEYLRSLGAKEWPEQPTA